MSKFVGTGPSSYEQRIYRAAVSQRLRNTGLKDTEPKFRNKCSYTCFPPYVFMAYTKKKFIFSLNNLFTFVVEFGIEYIQGVSCEPVDM
jgi:hypothetical protein